MAGAGLNHRLADIVGVEQVLTDASLRAGYEVDWTRRFHGHARAVVRPASTDEVSQVVRACAEAGVPVVPQGGNTGLVGGGVPDDSARAVVVSTRRLHQMDPVDTVAGQVTVGAGATLGRVQAHVRDAGWDVPVDLAARDSATIGGMVATNAGGVRVLRHGAMRANVLGVEAVLGDGTVVSHLGGLVKDNTGYDLAGLLCGSEGTLGIVTRVRLRLVPRWPDETAVWVACSSWDDAIALAVALRSRVEGLDALEAVDGACLMLGREELGLPPVLEGTPAVALLAVWSGAGEAPRSLVEAIGERPHAVATDPPSVARFWEPRDRMAEAIARLGVPHKLDVTVPLGVLATFAEEVPLVVAPARTFLFGHLGDGNLHVNVVEAGPDADERVLDLVAAHGGSISAEHGIGRQKAPWLHLSRSPAELAAFRAVKSALDPAGVMNPGVILAQPGH